MGLGEWRPSPLLLAAGLLFACDARLESPPPDAGGTGCDGVTCSSGFTCELGACVPTDPCANVSCSEPDERCHGGSCVSCELDLDQDGFEACIDCDDNDPDVIPGGDKPCESACGMGTVRCLGVEGWSDCSAPLECDCDAGDVRREPCGSCGTLERPCGVDHRWGPMGQCAESGQCFPGAVETEMCEACSERERQCTAQCAWGAWSTCTPQGACTPGDEESQQCDEGGLRTRACDDSCQWVAWGDCPTGECTSSETQDQDCGRCGTRSRTCLANGAWGDFGDCAGEGACTPDATDSRACECGGNETRSCTDQCQWGAWTGCPARECDPGDTEPSDCDRCSERVCTNQCTWGNCQLREGSQCEHEEGTNWRCCGTSRWQFCLPGCVWSDQCAVCSGCGC